MRQLLFRVHDGAAIGEGNWFAVWLHRVRVAQWARGVVTDLDELATVGDTALRYWTWVD